MVEELIKAARVAEAAAKWGYNGYEQYRKSRGAACRSATRRIRRRCNNRRHLQDVVYPATAISHADRPTTNNRQTRPVRKRRGESWGTKTPPTAKNCTKNSGRCIYPYLHDDSMCQRHTQTSLFRPPSDIRRMRLVLGPDVTGCIVVALCSVCQSVSSSRLGSLVSTSSWDIWD